MADIIIINDGRSFVVVLVIVITLKVDLLITDIQCAFRIMASGFP